MSCVWVRVRAQPWLVREQEPSQCLSQHFCDGRVHQLQPPPLCLTLPQQESLWAIFSLTAEFELPTKIPLWALEPGRAASPAGMGAWAVCLPHRGGGKGGRRSASTGTSSWQGPGHPDQAATLGRTGGKNKLHQRCGDAVVGTQLCPAPGRERRNSGCWSLRKRVREKETGTSQGVEPEAAFLL